MIIARGLYLNFARLSILVWLRFWWVEVFVKIRLFWKGPGEGDSNWGHTFQPHSSWGPWYQPPTNWFRGSNLLLHYHGCSMKISFMKKMIYSYQFKLHTTVQSVINTIDPYCWNEILTLRGKFTQQNKWHVIAFLWEIKGKWTKVSYSERKSRICKVQSLVN